MGTPAAVDTGHNSLHDTMCAGLTPWEIGLWGLRPQLWYSPNQARTHLCTQIDHLSLLNGDATAADALQTAVFNAPG